MSRFAALAASSLISIGSGLVVLQLPSACSLISTDGLTGGQPAPLVTTSAPDACAGDACTDAVASCSTNLQTDNANCGACGTVCGAGKSCAKSKCVSGCAGGVMFVSQASGNDGFDGCSQRKPKRTLGAALTASPTGGATSEIHVCAGTYIETDFELAARVSLLGGYDCLAWVRTATYGSPRFDGLSATILKASASNISGTTLVIGGADVDGSVVVDGFRVIGPAVTPSGIDSIAVEITGEAKPLVSNNDVVAAPQSPEGTYGIAVEAMAHPTIRGNRIDGGGGDFRAFGILVEKAGIASIQNNLITTGNSATSYVAAVSVNGAGTLIGANAITGNTLRPGAGIGGDKIGGSFGVFVSKSSADIIGNVIYGGKTTCAAGVTLCEDDVVFVQTEGLVEEPELIAGNRIVAGTASGGASALSSGIGLVQTNTTTIVNNAVQSGAPGTTTSVAIKGTGAKSIVASENTLFATGSIFSIDPGTELTATDNLLLGTTATPTLAITDNSCGRTASPAVTAFSGNALVGFGSVIASVQMGDSTRCAATPIATLADLTASEPAAMNNLVLSDACDNSDTQCLMRAACSPSAANGSACIETVLASWDDATEGAATVVDDLRTWKLGASAPCLIAQGGGAALAGMLENDAGETSTAFDITSAMRTSPVSIGAYEDDGACQ